MHALLALTMGFGIIRLGAFGLSHVGSSPFEVRLAPEVELVP